MCSSDLLPHLAPLVDHAHHGGLRDAGEVADAAIAVVHLRITGEAAETQEDAKCHLVLGVEVPYMHLGQCVLERGEVIWQVRGRFGVVLHCACMR